MEGHYFKDWFSDVATIAHCRIKGGKNRLSIDFAIVKLPVKQNTDCLCNCL